MSGIVGIVVRHGTRRLRQSEILESRIRIRTGQVRAAHRAVLVE